jgi:hypothetical protein
MDSGGTATEPGPKSKLDPWFQFKALGSDLCDYYKRYGGWFAIIFSPYTVMAIVITVLCWGAWRLSSWPEAPLSVLPALLGFSLAAYALLLAFGDERFRAFLAEETFDKDSLSVPNDNVLLGMSAIFLHFIFIQVLALLLAVVANGHPGTAFGGSALTTQKLWHLSRDVYAFVGYFAFVLSLMTALAAALNIYHATRMYVLFKAFDRSDKENRA